MTRYRARDHHLIASTMWLPDRPAERINDHIVMNRATSNVYAVAGPEGDVVINSGTEVQGERIRANLEAELGRKLKVSKLVFTQSHPDHTGGWKHFVDEGTEIIAQERFARICHERRMLGPFFARRNARVLAPLIPPHDKGRAWFETKDPEPLSMFRATHDFEVSGRKYRLISIPSGETLDALAVWMPEEKTLFIGNWAGAILGASPNFYTARGDRDRSIVFWLEDCRMLMDLGAELLVTGHDEPIVGAEAARAHLTRLHDAIQYLHDETVKGMNEGKTLPQLMVEIVWPERLALRDGRAPIRWYIRSIWEEYTGWFRLERTSELYATPPSAVWPELAEMAGGAAALAERAKEHLDRDEPEQALHMIEIALAVEPQAKSVREVELAIYEALLERSGGRHFDELSWLEGSIMETQAAPDA